MTPLAAPAPDLVDYARELSPEQSAAALAPLGDVCVTAGAGSGKTRVLVARFVHHVVEHRLPVHRIAALTFTEKAARQLRVRIAAALEAAVGPDARAEVARAPISTLHAFCARLLRRNAVAAGLDPAFRVLDETEAVLLREQARRRVEDRLEAHPEGAALWTALRRLPAPDPLRWAGTLLEKIRGAGADPRRLAWHGGRIGEAGARAAVLAAFVHVEREAAALASPPDTSAFRTLVTDALGGDAVALAKAEKPSTVFKPGTSRPYAALRAARDAVGEALVVWEGAVLDAEAQAHLPALRTVLGLLDAEADALKAERTAPDFRGLPRSPSRLDFTDLERLTLGLLERLAAAGARPEGLPAALLVDEHQDTSPIQEAILSRLRAHGLPQFSVGDPKQSIYRFRRADVRVLLAERERVGGAGGRLLAESYRAAPGLVSALNGLHRRLFADGRAGVEFEPLAAKADLRPPAAGAPPEVEWAMLRRGETDADDGRRREAAFIAARLKALVEGQTPRRKGPPDAVLGYGDCAVLVPTHKMLPDLERAFAGAGVPYRVHKGRGYLGAEEVRALVHALRVVHDPLDTHALACVVRGPALGASDARLLDWFGRRDAANEKVPPWEALRADDAADVRALVRHVDELRQLSTGARLTEVVAAAVDRFGLMHVALAQHDGHRRAANLRRAVSVADDVARAGHHGLSDFLAYLEELDALDQAQAEAPALAEGQEEVAFLTVHAAKGLEWPVVVLADVARKENLRGDEVHLDAGGAVAFALRDPLEGAERAPLGYAELQEAAVRAGREEALRLLYVATTRAEERLLLTGTFSAPTKEGLRKDAGWARALFEALGPPLEEGEYEIVLADARVRVTVALAPDEPEVALPAAGRASVEASGPTIDLEQLLAQTRADLAPWKGTRYVVSVSELMAFAESPAGLYRRRLEPEEDGPRPTSAPDEGAPPPEDPEERGRADAERAPWDIAFPGGGPGAPSPPESGLDRAALGRAVHALLERWEPRALPDVDGALVDACPAGFPPEARAAAEEMVARFARSPTAARLTEARKSGEDVRREPAFHARIRFPAGVKVATFEALLIKGTIDLWLPEGDLGLPEGGEVRLVDFKTNAPSRALPTPEAVAAHYAWQMRLYALAAERLLGRDVAGASLLLLDPAWGPEAVEIPVDVSGPALEETRRLCQAFATAELEDRWPADWRDLLVPATDGTAVGPRA